MKKLLDVARDEPVLLSNAVRTVVYAGVAFGLDVTAEQLGAVIVALEAVLALAVRLAVTPTHRAELVALEAARTARLDERATVADEMRSSARRIAESVPKVVGVKPAAKKPAKRSRTR